MPNTSGFFFYTDNFSVFLRFVSASKPESSKWIFSKVYQACCGCVMLQVGKKLQVTKFHVITIP